MNQKLVPRGIAFLLLAALVVLPIAAGVVLAVSSLLAVMGDPVGGAVLEYIALACGILWVVDVAALVLIQGLHCLSDHDEPPEP